MLTKCTFEFGCKAFKTSKIGSIIVFKEKRRYQM